MKEIDFDQLKQLQLEILTKVHTFCEDRGLQYFLAYGTLIGAIRHKGYIPWDDDIDIMMPRKDYDLFIRSFNGNVKDLVVISPELDNNYYAPYANVSDTRTILKEPTTSHRGLELGVKIDVFPLDSVPQDISEYDSFMNKMVKYNEILRYKRRRILKCTGIKMKCRVLINKMLYCGMSYSMVQRNIIRMIEKEKDYNSRYVDCAVFPAYKKKRFERALLESVVKVEFEGVLLNAPVGYDKILRIIYGDYMQVPPKEMQIGHHGFTAYWK